MTECPLFLLPAAQCSHCTAAEAVVEEPWYERGQEIKTREERDDEIDRDEESNRTIGVLYNQEHPGKWARAEHVYGGHDGQIDHEDLEME